MARAAPAEFQGDQSMVTHSSIHFYLDWAKARLDEMDATVASIESKAGAVKADARVQADKILVDLRKQRDAFRGQIAKQSADSEAAWVSAKPKLESDWNAFEASVHQYIETFSKQSEQQQQIFEVQAAAQLKAWREAGDKLTADAKAFAAERRVEFDAAVTRMNAEAAAAQEKLQKLNHAGTQSWSALMAALTETRAVFDRASKAAQEAFKRAA
jgi:predicted ATP-grasp superfamily ATP-dependent carboligase